MVKITVSDMCKGERKKLSQATRKVTIRGRADLRLDLCDECNKDPRIKKHTLKEYIALCYKLHGIDLDTETVDAFAKTIKG